MAYRTSVLPAVPFRGEASRREDFGEEGGAEEVTALKGRFLAVLNHEIRTPLSGIMGMTDLLLETSLDEEQREYVSAARGCAESLFEVLNATLEYSALTSGKVKLEATEFHLAEVIGAAISEHSFRAESKGLRLYSTYQGPVPETVIGDPQRLRQLLAQLISNAIKFTNHGQVELLVSGAGAGNRRADLLFQVKDTGIGIAERDLEHIFDSFRQVESGLSRAYAGLGLGLALVEKLAQLMDGRVWAESKVGQGSTFSFALVLDVSDEGADHAAQQSGSVRRVGKVLLVEDNDVAQRVFSHVLHRGHYHVDCVSSAQEAIDACRRSPYDLILMDLQMPGLNGIDATLAIRDLPGHRETPIVALTANSAEEHRNLCLSIGMQGYLLKPIPADELLAAVAAHIRL